MNRATPKLNPRNIQSTYCMRAKSHFPLFQKGGRLWARSLWSRKRLATFNIFSLYFPHPLLYFRLSSADANHVTISSIVQSLRNGRTSQQWSVRRSIVSLGWTLPLEIFLLTTDDEWDWIYSASCRVTPYRSCIAGKGPKSSIHHHIPLSFRPFFIFISPAAKQRDFWVKP